MVVYVHGTSTGPAAVRPRDKAGYGRGHRQTTPTSQRQCKTGSHAQGRGAQRDPWPRGELAPGPLKGLFQALPHAATCPPARRKLIHVGKQVSSRGLLCPLRGQSSCSQPPSDAPGSRGTGTSSHRQRWLPSGLWGGRAGRAPWRLWAWWAACCLRQPALVLP